MSARIRRARGVSRIAVLLFAIVVAMLVAWLLMSREDGKPRDEVAASGVAPARTAPDEASPTASRPAPTGSTPANDTSAAPPAPAPPAPASSGIDAKSLPPQAVATSAAPGSATSSPASAYPAGANAGEATFPRYWRRCFRDPGAESDYQVASDSSTAWSGSLSARVSSQVASPRSPGAGICQVIAATSVKGRRIRLTLHMRTLNATPGAHMVFRAEGGDGRVLAFYNMEPRWVSGTQDWAPYSAVLDVPEQASVVMFGGTLVNSGTLWIDDALIQIVGGDTAVTRGPPPGVQYNAVVDPASLSRALQNPGFEQVQPLAP